MGVEEGAVVRRVFLGGWGRGPLGFGRGSGAGRGVMGGFSVLELGGGSLGGGGVGGGDG